MVRLSSRARETKVRLKSRKRASSSSACSRIRHHGHRRSVRCEPVNSPAMSQASSWRGMADSAVWASGPDTTTRPPVFESRSSMQFSLSCSHYRPLISDIRHNGNIPITCSPSEAATQTLRRPMASRPWHGAEPRQGVRPCPPTGSSFARAPCSASLARTGWSRPAAKSMSPTC